MQVTITQTVTLTDAEVALFQRFHEAHTMALLCGSEHARIIANDLKPRVDKRWSRYLAWKREVGIT